MKLLAQGIQNLELKLKKYELISKGQKWRSKCQKLRITSSVIVTNILIKTQQFAASSFWIARYRYLAAVTLTMNHDLDILKMYLCTENKVAKASNSKYIAWIKIVRK